MKICVGFTTKQKKIERAIISRTSSDMNFDFCWNVFLHSKEGVNQGDPLAMITYGIGVLPLIRVLRLDHPQVYQPWYADDAGAGGGIREIMAHFREGDPLAMISYGVGVLPLIRVLRLDHPQVYQPW